MKLGLNKINKQKHIMNISLHIGINYDNELQGCENDARHLQDLVVTNMGFQPAHSKLLLGKDATKKNIIREIENLALITHRTVIKTVFISYSGHGTYQADNSGDEKDGRDEVIVPYDRDYIKDDTIHTLLGLFHERTTVVGFFDCCHSGTIFDLPYRYIQGDKHVHEHEPKDAIKAKCIMISGCQDKEVASETWADGKVLGALTTAFTIVLHDEGFNITCYNMLRKIRQKLSDAGYGFQVPQITTNERLHGTYPFIADQNNRPFLDFFNE